jgi:hypothetical protein
MSIVKTDDRTFVRDTASHALLNIDRQALARSRSERAARDRAARLTKQVAD